MTFSFKCSHLPSAFEYLNFLEGIAIPTKRVHGHACPPYYGLSAWLITVGNPPHERHGSNSYRVTSHLRPCPQLAGLRGEAEAELLLTRRNAAVVCKFIPSPFLGQIMAPLSFASGLSSENFWLFFKKNQSFSCKGKLKRSLLLLPIRRLRFPLLSGENFWLLEIMFRWIFKGEEGGCIMHLQLRKEIWNESRTNFVQWPEAGSLQRGKWK